MVVVDNVTFNNILAMPWLSVLSIEKTGVPGENHQPDASNCQTLSHNIASGTPRHERDFELTTLVVICTDCTGSCVSNCHTITTTAAL